MKKNIFLLLTLISLSAFGQKVINVSSNISISTSDMNAFSVFFITPTGNGFNVTLGSITATNKEFTLVNTSDTYRVLINGRDTLSPKRIIKYYWTNSEHRSIAPDLAKYYSIYGDTLKGDMFVDANTSIRNKDDNGNYLTIGQSGYEVRANSEMYISSAQSVYLSGSSINSLVGNDTITYGHFVGDNNVFGQLGAGQYWISDDVKGSIVLCDSTKIVMNAFGSGFGIGKNIVVERDSISFLGDASNELLNIDDSIARISTPYGAVYADDYSDSYTDRSLVDKGYVDDTISNYLPTEGADLTVDVTSSFSAGYNINGSDANAVYFDNSIAGMYHTNASQSSEIELSDERSLMKWTDGTNGSVIQTSDDGVGITTFTPGVAHYSHLRTDSLTANVTQEMPKTSGYLLNDNNTATFTNKSISGSTNTITNVPISTAISGLGTGVATFLGTPSSANLATALTDETGSGAAVFATSPTFTTPNIGAANGTSLTLGVNFSAASWTTSGVKFILNPIRLTNTTSSGTVAIITSNLFGGDSLDATSPTTYTNAYGSTFEPPVARTGGNVTIGTNWAARFNGRAEFNSTVQITGAFNLAGNLSFTGGNRTISGSNALFLQSASGSNLVFQTGGSNTRFFLDGNGIQNSTMAALSSGTTPFVTYVQPAHTGGAQPGLLWTGGALTGQTASAEIIDQDWNNSATLTRAAGTVSLQRMARLRGRTYAFASASTIGVASAFDVEQCIAGTNATITNNFCQRWIFDATTYLGISAASDGKIGYTAFGSAPEIQFNTLTRLLGGFASASSFQSSNFASATVGSGMGVQATGTNTSILFSGSSAVSYRNLMRGATQTTVPAGEAYGGLILGNDGYTEAASGNHRYGARLVVFPPLITNGAATTDTSAAILVVGPTTGATVNLAMEVTTGTTYLKSGSLGIGVVSPTEKIHTSGNVLAAQYKLSALNTAPSSASDTGTTGEIRIDASFIYICTATNTWKRVAIATW